MCCERSLPSLLPSDSEVRLLLRLNQCRGWCAVCWVKHGEEMVTGLGDIVP